MNLLLWGFIIVFLVSSCTYVYRDKSDMEELQNAVERFNDDLLWRDYQAAASFIPSEKKELFWKTAEAMRQTVRITRITIQSIETIDGLVFVHLLYTFYRLDDPRLRNMTLHQKWLFDSQTNRWKLQDSQLERILGRSPT